MHLSKDDLIPLKKGNIFLLDIAFCLKILFFTP